MKDKHDRSLKKMKSFDSVSTCNNNVRNHMKSYEIYIGSCNNYY